MLRPALLVASACIAAVLTRLDVAAERQVALAERASRVALVGAVRAVRLNLLVRGGGDAHRARHHVEVGPALELGHRDERQQHARAR
eukprot:6186276-Pleurochrysis_carterae.AAC.3